MIAVIDVTGNNLTSLTNAIKQLGYPYILTHDSTQIKEASHVILPGVGAAATAMAALKHHQLIDTLLKLSQPLLGICLGMQLLMDYSEEENISCLKRIPGCVKRLTPNENHPVPHMGWNQLIWKKNSPLAQGLSAKDYVYFVHSYALLDAENAVARCQYNQEFTAIVQYQNVYGMQFHPEKSATVGLTLLNNFLQLESLC
ncbi:imidazole glycerol phosphate synthase subunit HisH [Legionella hackeliae]|uniref:Imidazole glycerol phosphate synthase subunit HisH n=1 Tax=Legionella hackeliae TaxID=449 RepID=A0A0A8UTM4_LEGHA|nr:imidazole glycerol phosphate synthase subunit HisH [Legionella hackeliae]KTD13748.1 imidazole glycerol phosphate synthase subunit HisH [Legionella hackeliae]CEK10447.1 Imidazole glycerol phosphate synthase subunit hisH 2 [Legionella hackeliae]STX47183.1 glutamine amidotransferase [Legionella hackeliae]